MKSKKETSAGSSTTKLEKKLAEITHELERKNRDLEVEESLERVRAQALSMTRPAELLGICEILFTELEKLGFNELRNSQIFIYNDYKGSFTNYGYSEYEGAAIAEIFYNSHPKVNDFVTAVRKTNDAFAELSISGDELKAWRDYRIENGEPDDPRLANINTLFYYFYSIGTGAIGISTFSAAGPEQIDVLKRFRNVFDLAYRRYTDIQLAEAQAREAQVELALERVRARAMAMQNSGELSDLVATLFDELTKLDFALSWCVINIINENALLNTVWIANLERGRAPESFKIPFADYPYPNAILKAWKERRTKWVYDLGGKEKEIYTEFLLTQTEAARVPEAVKASMRANKRNFVSFSFSNFGGLQTTSAEPLSDESLDILSRFGKVFDLTYTRFNDLKQAEEQAREAQIELALERVRARTMAMQHSDELVDTAAILFKQVKDLSVEVWTCGFQIWKPGEPGTTIAYMTLPDGTIRVPFEIPHTPEPFLNRAYEAAVRGDQFYVEELGGDALAAHYKYMLALPGSSDRMADISAGGFHLPEFQVNHNAYFSEGSLLFITYKPVPESWDIFKRFAKVFEQTYTRFLDLKKAEAQAREGQIELALERVRARTMAMQHSDELAETAYILFQQFRELGENPDQATIGIVNEAEGVIEYWVTIYGNQTNRVFKFPIDEPNVTRKIYDAWKAEEKSLVIDLSGQALYNFSKFRESMGGAGFNEAEQRRIINVAFFSRGLINVQSTVERSVESLRLLERFANVFEGTYTRFLDLKKAEAQAREAQIELALERVRAKTMSMQHSDELLETSQVVFQQLRDLGETADQIGIAIVKEKDGVFDLFATLHGTQMVRVFQPKIDDPFVMGKVYKNWKAHKRSFVVELGGDQLRQYNILRNQ